MGAFPISLLATVIGLLVVGASVLAVAGYVLPSLRRNAGKTEWLPNPNWTFAWWLTSLAFVVYLALTLDDVGKYAILLAGMFAGISAVCAASIAYVGVTSKTRLDRQLAAESGRLEELNIRLKTEHMCRKLLDEANAVRERFRKVEPWTLGAEGELYKGEDLWKFRLPIPKQLDNLWQNLGLLPPEVRNRVRDLSLTLERAHAEAERLMTPTPGWTPDDGKWIFNADTMFEACRETIRLTEEILAMIEPHPPASYTVPADAAAKD